MQPVPVEIYDLSTFALLFGIIGPLFVFLLITFSGTFGKENGHRLGITCMGMAWIAAFSFQFDFWQTASPFVTSIDWFRIAEQRFAIGLRVDAISAIMLLIIWLVSGLVHLFSLEYMKTDPHKGRYFSYLGLFTFSMLALVVTSNLLVLYICWELVGFSSYLLIGFWKEKEAPNRAAKKAFVLNRVGDAGFLLGLMIVYSEFHTLDWHALGNLLSVSQFSDSSWQLLAGGSFVLAAVAKSAQFPLAIWLPDAMEGPTPVSALIHAATMVAAGVYLLIRVQFLFLPEIETLLLSIGAITATLGGFAALTQTDIKKVLAYSTVSQLGFMFIGLGAGSGFAAFFHLWTHAFFKAGLFLGAGSIIHALHQAADRHSLHFDVQNMRLMGGLRKRLPLTFVTYCICSLALVGLPLTSGFLSKETILMALWQPVTEGSLLGWAVFLLAILAIVLTAAYVIRMLLLVFFGVFQNKRAAIFGSVEEGKWQMKFPLVVLSGLSLGLAFSFTMISVDGFYFSALDPFFNENIFAHPSFDVTALSVLAIATGGGLGYWKYKNPQQGWEIPPHLQRIPFHFFYLDKGYVALTQRVLLPFSKKVAHFDKAVIDRSIDVLGKSVVAFGVFSALIDRYLIDGAVRSAYYIFNGLGFSAQGMQSQKVQRHLLEIFVVGLLIIFVTFFLIGET